MQRFRNILVIIDEKTESGAVVGQAVDLALRNGARITLVRTISELPPDGENQLAAEIPAESGGPIPNIIEDWPPATDLPPTPPQSEIRREPLAGRDPESADWPGWSRGNYWWSMPGPFLWSAF